MNPDKDSLQLKSRKAKHVQLVIDEDVGVEKASNGFEYFEIIPKSIPDINYHDISLDTEFMGRKFDAPILIAGMTGDIPRQRG